MRVVLRAGFDRFSGYGNDAVDLAVNLDRLGVDVLPWPTSTLPGLPRMFTRLLEKNPTGQKDVVLAFGPPFEIKPWEFTDLAPIAVGYSMWERSKMISTDLPWGRKSRRWSVHGLRGMAVTCPMNLDAFRALDPDLPMTIVPGGIESEHWPVEHRYPHRPMRFLMIGALGGRKNPFALLETWREMKREMPDFDATLHLHTTTVGLHPGICEAYGPDVTMSERPLTREALVDLYHGHDVLISTSRGEGNDKPAMEFMATGGPVIATDWGGHQNWLTDAACWPVRGDLVPVAPNRPDVLHFEVDRQDLKAQILSAWLSPREVTKRGEYAAKWIRSSASWDVVVPKLVRFLGECAG